MNRPIGRYRHKASGALGDVVGWAQVRDELPTLTMRPRNGPQPEGTPFPVGRNDAGQLYADPIGMTWADCERDWVQISDMPITRRLDG